MAMSIEHQPEIETAVQQETFATRHARVLAGAAERIHSDIMELRRRGLVDAEGQRIANELPDDMKPGALRDFGG